MSSMSYKKGVASLAVGKGSVHETSHFAKETNLAMYVCMKNIRRRKFSAS